MTPSFRFPLLAGGTAMCAARFPPLREGNLKEGGQSGTLTARLVQQKGGKAQLASLPLTVRRGSVLLTAA